MSRKTLLFILIPALLLISGYAGVQIYMRSGIKKEKNKLAKAYANLDTLTEKADTLGGKKASALDLRPLFIQRLQLLLKKSSDGLYNLTVGDLKVDVTASTISLHDVAMRPDAAQVKAMQMAGLLPADVFTVSFKDLLIEGVNLDDAVNSKKMDYKLIKLVNPLIEIDHKKKSEKPATKEDFSQRFLKEMESLSIGNLQIEGGTILVHDRQEGTSKKIGSVQVRMKDILVNKTTRLDKDRFLFAKEAMLQFGAFNTRTKDGMYGFSLSGASVDAAQKQITLKNLHFGSTASKEVFVKKQKQAKEMYNLSLPVLTLTGVDWWPAFNGEEMVADNVETSGGRFYVYFDRALPPANKMGNFPNQMLMKLPLKVDINTLRFRNLDVAYEEHNPLSGQSGTLFMDNATLAITNVHNNGKTRSPMLVNGSALFMHKVPIKANFRFDMNDYKAGTFSAAINSTTPFDSSLLNSFAEPLGMMKLEKGELQKLAVNIHGNELGASGDVQVLYKDLKLSMLEKNKGEPGLNTKHVTSFLANLLVLKGDNPKGNKPPRTAQASFKRDPEQGFMALVWKTILVGVLKTVGAPEKIAYKKTQ